MKNLLFPLTIGLIGTVILLALGNWQVQRLAWKEGKIAEIEAQIFEPAVPFAQADIEGLVEFQAVSTSGTYLDGEAHVLRSIKGKGVVFRIISPFETEEGRRILVDRGYVSEVQKTDRRVAGEATIIANYRTPEEVDFWTPEPDWANNYVFARDVPALADHFQTEPILLILRETSEENPAITPWPVDTSGIPNDHLQYAITWFSLAATWMGMTGLWIARMRRRKS